MKKKRAVRGLSTAMAVMVSLNTGMHLQKAYATQLPSESTRSETNQDVVLTLSEKS